MHGLQATGSQTGLSDTDLRDGKDHDADRVEHESLVSARPRPEHGSDRGDDADREAGHADDLVQLWGAATEQYEAEDRLNDRECCEEAGGDTQDEQGWGIG